MWWWLGAVALADGTMTPEGIEVRARREQAVVVIEVDVPPGLHVYGHKEKTGRPLEVYVAGEPVRAKVPPGRRVEVEGMPPAYWLEGVVRIEAFTKANEGEVRVQACAVDACYPPERMPWVVAD